jgi:hypothetical protein
MTGNENHIIAMKKRMAIVAVACCAIEADGEVDDQEVAVVIKNLNAHPLFKDSDHNEESIKKLIFKCMDSFKAQEAMDEDLDSDDIADCRVQTVNELAKNLNHEERLSAFVIAAFTVNADNSIAFAEFLYLSALSKALDIYEEEKVQKVLSCAQMNAKVEHHAADEVVEAAANGDWEGIDTMFES